MDTNTSRRTTASNPPLSTRHTACPPPPAELRPHRAPSTRQTLLAGIVSTVSTELLRQFVRSVLERLAG